MLPDAVKAHLQHYDGGAKALDAIELKLRGEWNSALDRLKAQAPSAEAARARCQTAYHTAVMLGAVALLAETRKAALKQPNKFDDVLKRVMELVNNPTGAASGT